MARMSPVWAALFALALVGCSSERQANANGGTSQPPVREAPKAHPKCPEFSYRLLDGGKVSLASSAGKHLLVYVTSYT